MAKSGWHKKMANIREMQRAFETMPRALANSAHGELTSTELNGRPINRISGNLANSWGVVNLRRGVAALKQVSTQAPYAPRVMVPVAIARMGKPALTLLMDRMKPRFDKAIFAEFKRIEGTINRGGAYKFDPAKFEASI